MAEVALAAEVEVEGVETAGRWKRGSGGGGGGNGGGGGDGGLVLEEQGNVTNPVCSDLE